MKQPLGLLRPVVPGRRVSEVAARLGLRPLDSSAVVKGIAHDSRCVRPGDLYVGRAGQRNHGAAFSRQAAAAGAVAILTDASGAEMAMGVDVPVIVVADPGSEMGGLAAWLYGRPSERLDLVGITGTNGKTTVAKLVEAGASACGARVGVIGTTGIAAPGLDVASARTTPEASELQAVLAVMADSGVDTVALEVSSHALALGRVNGCRFRVAVFTNLGGDHLDFHGDQEAYFAAKRSLFERGRCQLGIINRDDPWGRRLLWEGAIDSESFGMAVGAGRSGAADWTALDVTPQGIGYRYRLVGPGVDVGAGLRLPGWFNLSNAVAAAAAAVRCGHEPGQVAAGIAKAAGPPGRMEAVDVASGATVLVDYAHTPDAVEAALGVGRDLARCRSGRLRVVIGAGGNRDKGKRRRMGAVAGSRADEVIVTDDNPRWEDPALIRAELLAGVRQGQAAVAEIPDRAEAVAAALAGVSSIDVVLILGKGHESGQEIAGVVHPMVDTDLVRKADPGGRT